MPILLPSPSSPERQRVLAGELLRQRTLGRLYKRKAAIEDLIQSLEVYQRMQDEQVCSLGDLSVERKCS